MQISRSCIVVSLLFCAGLGSAWADDIFQLSYVTAPSTMPQKYVVNDYDGDGMSDVAIYSESQGLVYIYSLTNGLIFDGAHFGGPGWMPFPGDFNGDAYCDMAMYNYTSGDWYILINRTWQVLIGQMGGTGFVPAIADYDGDGVSDIGVYNVFTARWYIYSLTKGVLYWDIQFGEPYPDPQFDPHVDFPSIPIAADFDGDGKADLALYMNKFSNEAFQTFLPGWAVLFSRTKTVSYVVAPPVNNSYTGYYWNYESVLLNNGNGMFELSTYAGKSCGYITLSGDYNGDGKYETARYSLNDWDNGTWYLPSREGVFGGPAFGPITEICTRYDECIWGNAAGYTGYIDLSGKYGGILAWLTIENNKVFAHVTYHEVVYTEYYSGGIIGDEIWLMCDHDTFNADNISRGSISHNPIIIYDYSNGKKTGGYWEFSR